MRDHIKHVSLPTSYLITYNIRSLNIWIKCSHHVEDTDVLSLGESQVKFITGKHGRVVIDIHDINGDSGDVVK